MISRALVPLVLLALSAGAAPALADAPPALTIDEAVRIARASHPSLRAQHALLEQTRARLEQARAGFLPGLTGSIAYNPQTANFAATPGFQRVLARPATTGTFATQDATGAAVVGQCSVAGGNCPPLPATPALPTTYDLFNYWTAGVGLSWTIFDWGKTFFAWRAAANNASAQALTEAAQSAEIVLSAKVAFYGALAAEGAVAVSAEAVATQQRHADQVRSFFSVGSRTKIDVATAESDVANAELTLARARGNLESARAILAAALGDESWRPYRLVTPPQPEALVVPDENAAIGEALRARPEVRELVLRGKSALDVVRSTRGAFLPVLTVQGGPTWAGTDLAKLTPNLTATVALTFPLFGGMNPLLVHGQLREAEANLDLTAAQEALTRNAIRLEAAQAHSQLAASQEAVLAVRKLVGATQQRRDLAEGRYQAGVGSILELSDAQLAFVNARFQEVQAVLDLAVARARLEKALGR